MVAVRYHGSNLVGVSPPLTMVQRRLIEIHGLSVRVQKSATVFGRLGVSTLLKPRLAHNQVY